MKESQLREHVNKGWIHAIITYNVVGKPASHIEEALSQYLENIHTDERIIVIREDREEASEVDDGVFSTFCEQEALVKDLETFTWLCINFSPSSIEILQPDEITIKGRDITNWLNDLLAKLHEIGTNVRSHMTANDHLTLTINQLIKNVIILSLGSGPKDQEALSKSTGIAEEQLEPFLEHMMKKGLVILEDKKYLLPAPGTMIVKHGTDANAVPHSVATFMAGGHPAETVTDATPQPQKEVAAKTKGMAEGMKGKRKKR